MEIEICPTITKHNRHKVNKDRDKPPDPPACIHCANKPYCKALCAPMERIVAQVEVEPGREKPRSIDYKQWAKIPNGNSTTKNIILLFFIDHKSPKEIAETLYKSQTYVYREIAKVRRLIDDYLAKIG